MCPRIKIADIALIVCFIIIGFIPMIFLSMSTGHYVEVRINGQIVYKLPLDENCEICLNDIGKLIIENGQVCVKESLCEDHDCEKMGWISTAGNAIVCMPNRLLVTIIGGKELDAVAG